MTLARYTEWIMSQLQARGEVEYADPNARGRILNAARRLKVKVTTSNHHCGTRYCVVAKVLTPQPLHIETGTGWPS